MMGGLAGAVGGMMMGSKGAKHSGDGRVGAGQRKKKGMLNDALWTSKGPWAMVVEHNMQFGCWVPNFCASKRSDQVAMAQLLSQPCSTTMPWNALGFSWSKRKRTWRAGRLFCCSRKSGQGFGRRPLLPSKGLLSFCMIGKRANKLAP